MSSGVRLHVGCGGVHHAGWVNIDIQSLPGVDRVLDVREGLPFGDVEFIFAEHFLEHLHLPDGLRLLAECRRVLAPGGVLRLTTPNLDWVWATSYASRWVALSPTRASIDTRRWRHDAAAARDSLALNRAFHAWGHRFLYNRAMLACALDWAGFERVEWEDYGTSHRPELVGLERHERYPDLPEVAHLLVAEASGIGVPERDAELTELVDTYSRELALG